MAQASDHAMPCDAVLYSVQYLSIGSALWEVHARKGLFRWRDDVAQDNHPNPGTTSNPRASCEAYCRHAKRD